MSDPEETFEERCERLGIPEEMREDVKATVEQLDEDD